ncbi:hypothetical protein HKX48_004201 [Thoreauomyces humboldtii]|nr:hypothetical protein HKX48_004201 [Thoreauomyces humboldtii]
MDRFPADWVVNEKAIPTLRNLGFRTEVNADSFMLCAQHLDSRVRLVAGERSNVREMPTTAEVLSHLVTIHENLATESDWGHYSVAQQDVLLEVVWKIYQSLEKAIVEGSAIEAIVVEKLQPLPAVLLKGRPPKWVPASYINFGLDTDLDLDILALPEDLEHLKIMAFLRLLGAKEQYCNDDIKIPEAPHAETNLGAAFWDYRRSNSELIPINYTLRASQANVSPVDISLHREVLFINGPEDFRNAYKMGGIEKQDGVHSLLGFEHVVILTFVRYLYLADVRISDDPAYIDGLVKVPTAPSNPDRMCEIVLQLIRFGDQIRINDTMLFASCEKYMISKVDYSNVAEIWQHAKMYHAEQLLKWTASFISHSWEAVETYLTKEGKPEILEDIGHLAPAAYISTA